MKRAALEVETVRGLDGLMSAMAVRALVYGGEQACPLNEEFDGNDFSGATHLIARLGSEPIGTLRLRWFADFAKVERVAVAPRARNGAVARALIQHAVKLAARKGYTRLLGHIEPGLIGFWRRALGVKVREDRPAFRFSDRDYVEIELSIKRAIDAIDADTAPMILLRPEDDWDRPGVLERSIERPPAMEAAWKR